MVLEPPTCSICKQPKKRLAMTTAQTQEAIFVCSEPVGKARMPCDGGIWALAQRAT